MLTPSDARLTPEDVRRLAPADFHAEMMIAGLDAVGRSRGQTEEHQRLRGYLHGVSLVLNCAHRYPRPPELVLAVAKALCILTGDRGPSRGADAEIDELGRLARAAKEALT